MDLIADRIKPFTELNVFDEIRTLCGQYKALNVASGEPDFDPPQFLKEELKQTLDLSEHQYGNLRGSFQLRQKLSQIFSIQLEQQLDPEKNIFIGLGAQGVLFVIFYSFLQEGDEVLCFSPFFQIFDSMAKLCNAKFIDSAMEAPQSPSCLWKIDFDDFKSKITNKTKILVLNSPSNPSGKVFTEEEYLKIAEILEPYPNIIVISDEVTINVGSLGKMFSCTGWRCGYAIASEDLIKCLVYGSQNVFYTVFRPCQIAFSNSLDLANQAYKNDKDFLSYTCNKFQSQRDYVVQNFPRDLVDIEFFKPQGGYFMVMNIEMFVKNIPEKYFYPSKNIQGNQYVGKPFAELENPESTPDVAFVRYFIQQVGVAFLPLSKFYVNDNVQNIKDIKGKYYVRMALCNKQNKYEQMIERIKIYFAKK